MAAARDALHVRLAMDLSQPLTDAELDELDAFLMSDGTSEATMDISMLDGLPRP